MSNIKEAITSKLMKVFKNDRKSFIRIMMILDDDEINKGENSTKWCTLKVAIDDDETFAEYANSLVGGIEIEEEIFDRVVEVIETQLLEETSDENFEPDEINDNEEILMQRIQLAIRNAKPDNNKIAINSAPGMAAAWAIAKNGVPKAVMGFAKKSYMKVISSTDEVVGLVGKNAGTITMVVLAVTMVTYETYKNIRSWYKGEISGNRCCKNIVDSISEIGGSCVGGIGGAFALGAMGVANPLILASGGILLGLLGGKAARYLSERLTGWLFGLKQSTAVENAYRFFGLEIKASNHEINVAFRKLCLKHHPDKGGKAEDFHFVQINMEIIRQSKGVI